MHGYRESGREKIKEGEHTNTALSIVYKETDAQVKIFKYSS